MPRAMVLAAGLGTRLRPLTHELPKPLLPYGDRTLLEHALALLEKASLGPDVVVNTHHLPEAFERERARGGFSLAVELVHEPTLRGTAGGIAGARSRFEPGPIVVATSDVVLDAVPADLVERAGGGDMVLAVQPRPRGRGTVGLGANGRVVRLRGRLFGEEVSGGDYVGLMALGERALSELPEWGCYIQDYALPHLARGGPIETVTYAGRFLALGDELAAYLSENLRWLDATQGGRSLLAERSRLDPGVELERSIVSRGASVAGAGCLSNCVVLPEARARAPLANAIVTPSGLVVGP